MTKKQKQAKIARVMREFKAGTLKSSSGEKITNYKQAVAVALSEAGMSMPKKDASEDYMRAFIRQVLQEEEAMEEEKELAEEEMELQEKKRKLKMGMMDAEGQA